MHTAARVCGLKNVAVILDRSNGYKQSRDAKVRWVRQLAISLCRWYKIGNHQYIAECFGLNSHTTVWHAEKVVMEETKQFKPAREQMVRCLARLESKNLSILMRTPPTKKNEA